MVDKMIYKRGYLYLLSILGAIFKSITGNQVVHGCPKYAIWSPGTVLRKSSNSVNEAFSWSKSAANSYAGDKSSGSKFMAQTVNAVPLDEIAFLKYCLDSFDNTWKWVDEAPMENKMDVFFLLLRVTEHTTENHDRLQTKKTSLTSTRAHNGDLLIISVKFVDIFMNPFQCQLLVFQTHIPRIFWCTKWQKSKNS